MNNRSVPQAMCETQLIALTPAALWTGFALSINWHLVPLPKNNILMIKYKMPQTVREQEKESTVLLKELKILICKPKLNL